MSKKFKGKPCVSCENMATTADHIISREFFPRDARANLPQAPMCEKHNNQKSILEHYLTAMLPFGARSSNALQVLNMTEARLAKNKKLAHQLNAEMPKEPITEKGLHELKDIELSFDGDKLLNYYELIAIGLGWHHWKKEFYPERVVVARFFTNEVKTLVDNIFLLESVNYERGNLGNGTFLYEVIEYAKNPNLTIWRMTFYGGLMTKGEHPDTVTDAYVALGHKDSISRLKLFSS